MKIPFDIKFRPQIESGEYKVETRDGKSTRIICWDRKYGYPISGLAYEKATGCENYVNAYKNGMTSINGIIEMNDDLFIITPESELTEFEQAYMRIVHKMKPEEFNEEGLKTAKENAAELFELAKDEIYSHESLVEYAEKAKEEGRKEALKDLPRWRKCADCTPKPKYSNEWIFSIDSENVTRESAIVHNGYFLSLDRLEKLPGFNE